MKHWYKFDDGSIAFIEKCFQFIPIAVYSSQELGFGEWILIEK